MRAGEKSKSICGMILFRRLEGVVFSSDFAESIFQKSFADMISVGGFGCVFLMSGVAEFAADVVEGDEPGRSVLVDGYVEGSGEDVFRPDHVITFVRSMATFASIALQMSP